MKIFIIESYGFYAMKVDIVIAEDLNRAMKLCFVEMKGNNIEDYEYESHIEFSTRKTKEGLIESYGYSE